MKNSIETRLGMFFALALVATVLLIELTGGMRFFRRGDQIHALFGNIQDLKEGDPVKMAGFNIGRVEKIGLDQGKVRVTMRIDKGTELRSDSKATIRFTGLMGQNFVSVTFGSPTAPLLSDNQIIETQEAADFASLMVKLEGVAGGIENITKTFSGEGFKNLLGPLADFVRENTPRLSATFENLKTVSTKIAAGEGTIGKLIFDETLVTTAVNTISNLNTELTATTTDLRGILAEGKTVMTKIQSGEGSLGKVLNDPALFNQATATLTNMRQIMERINQGQGSVGKLVNDESFFRNIKMTLQKVEKATEGFEDQGALGVLSIAVGALF